MGFTVKDWKNATTHEGGGDETTPISAASLEDVELRVTDYAEAPDQLHVNNTERVSNTPLVGFGNTTPENLPMNFLSTIEASTVDATPGDIISINEQTHAYGDFTGKTGFPGGGDLGFVWGKALTACLGAPDNAGGTVTAVTDFIGYEAGAVIVDNSDITYLFGFRAFCGFLGDAADTGHADWAYSIYAIEPQIVPGAAGTIDNAVALRVGAPTMGGTSNFALLVDEGATSRFSGAMDIGSGVVRGLATDGIGFYAGSGASQSYLYLGSVASWGGHVWVELPNAGAQFQVKQGDAKTTENGAGWIAVSPDGTQTKRIGIDNSGNVAATAV